MASEARATPPSDIQPIAFLILAHTDPVHVRRLVNRLMPHDVFIHLDAKTPLSELWHSIDARFVTPRVPVYWAGYSQVEATLALLRTALASGQDYSKIVLISGTCYPIVGIDKLAAMFASDGGTNYIRYVDMRGSGHLPTLISRRYKRDGILPWTWTARHHTLMLAEKIFRKLYELTIGRMPDPWTLPLIPYHGSSWWALSPEAARYAIAELYRHTQLSAKYRRSFASDEQVFHTIIGNSPFAAKSTGRIPFTGRGTWKAANLHLIDPSLSRWFTAEDLDEVLASPHFFVRKVRTIQSTELLDALDKAAGVKSPQSPPDGPYGA